MSITQGEEDLSFVIGTGKLFDANTGEKVEEFEGLATDMNPERSWAIAFFDPQAVSPTHFHKERVENYFIYQGTGTVRLGEESIAVSPGVHVCIPAGIVYKVVNSERGQMILAVKCAPSWIFSDVHFTE